MFHLATREMNDIKMALSKCQNARVETFIVKGHEEEAQTKKGTIVSDKACEYAKVSITENALRRLLARFRHANKENIEQIPKKITNIPTPDPSVLKLLSKLYGHTNCIDTTLSKLDGKEEPSLLNKSAKDSSRSRSKLVSSCRPSTPSIEDVTMRRLPPGRAWAIRQFPDCCGKDASLDMEKKCPETITLSTNSSEEDSSRPPELMSSHCPPTSLGRAWAIRHFPDRCGKDAKLDIEKKCLIGSSLSISPSVGYDKASTIVKDFESTKEKDAKEVDIYKGKKRKMEEAQIEDKETKRGKKGSSSRNKDYRVFIAGGEARINYNERACIDLEASKNLEDKDEEEVGAISRSKKMRKEETHDMEKKDSWILQSDKNSMLRIESTTSRSLVHFNDVKDQTSFRDEVKMILSTFRKVYEKLLQGESSRLKEGMRRVRTDLMAYSLFRETADNRLFKEKLYKENNYDGPKFMGGVPGLEIGDMFHLRVELCILGVHCQVQAGIDYIKQDGRNLAVSIVSSGRYANGMSTSDVLVYSGSGVPNKDQKLEKGNLALKNSMDSQSPVRVIYGFRESQTNPKATMVTYIYDGLYLVEKCWTKRDGDGHSVIMFRLRRIPGQRELRIKGIMRSRRPKSHLIMCNEDISQGEEDVPIRVVNTIDNEQPKPFKYATKMRYPPLHRPTPTKGCDCFGGCSDGERCACTVRNGKEIPFNDSGAIMKARPLVHECGPSCKCPSTCRNRVSQHGIKIELEIFKTKSRGWGVRSPNFIPSGSFICEYVGELLEDEKAQKRANDEYLFAIGNYNYDLLTTIPCLKEDASSEVLDELGFTIDASQYGNVGRFINHSCSPNLYAQNLIYDHDTKSMPHIMFFASEDIPPFRELMYDYNYSIDQVYDSNGKVKKKKCWCESIECRGWLY